MMGWSANWVGWGQFVMGKVISGWWFIGEIGWICFWLLIVFIVVWFNNEWFWLLWISLFFSCTTFFQWAPFSSFIPLSVLPTMIRKDPLKELCFIDSMWLIPYFFEKVKILKHIRVLIGDRVKFFINSKVTGPKLMMNIFIINLEFMHFLIHLSYSLIITLIVWVDLIEFFQQPINDLKVLR